MMFNPLLAERLAEESRKDAMRKAKQARLIRGIKGAMKCRDQGERVTLVPKSLFAPFVRAQS